MRGASERSARQPSPGAANQVLVIVIPEEVGI